MVFENATEKTMPFGDFLDNKFLPHVRAVVPHQLFGCLYLFPTYLSNKVCIHVWMYA